MLLSLVCKGMLKKFFLFFVGSFFLFSHSISAQSTGYNIVNNFFNPDGSFNDQAFKLIAGGSPNPAVTVRLTSAELQLYPNLVSLIQSAAQRYGISNITWQPEDWSATTPEQFNNFWIDHLSQITMGQISLFTEYNYHYGNPDNYAQILISALNAGFQVPIASTNFNTTNPSGINPFGGQMLEYVEFLNQVQASCASSGRAGCLNEIPVWSVSIYAHYTGDVGVAVDDFINQFNNFRNTLSSFGIDLSGKQFVVPEVGLDPSLPINQRLAAAADFITALEARVHGDPGFSSLIDSMTFLFMDDKTGKQYLIVKIDGRWVVLDYEDYGLVGLSGRGSVGGEPKRVGSAHGRSFIATKTVCWDRFDEAVSAIVKALEFNISKNDSVADNLREANSLLIPPGRDNKSKAEESEGEITFEVCQNNTRNWFTTEDSIKISVPASYMQASTNGVQVGGYLNPKGVDSSEIAYNVPKNTNPGPIVAAPEGESGDYVSIRSFSCSATSWQVNCTLVVDAGHYGHVWVEVNGQFLGVNAVGRGLTYYYNANVGGEKPESYTVSASVTNHDTSDPKLSDGSSCTIVFDTRGNGTCSGSGVPIEPPEPPLCVPRDNEGEPMEYEGRDTSGITRIPMDHGYSLERFLQELAKGFGVCDTVEFVFTPVTSVAYTMPDEEIQRENIYQLFAPPGAEEDYLFRHGETQDIFEARGRDSSIFETALDIFGQKGVDKAKKKTIEYLQPPK